MATTLVEYQKLANDIVAAGIADTIVKESPLMARMPMLEMVGNSYKYNLESALAGIGRYSVGDTWVESPPTWAQRSVALTIYGGDVDVDDFARQTLGNVQDQKTPLIVGKAKAMAYALEEDLIYGGTTASPITNAMDGLLLRIAQVEGASVTDLDGLNNDSVYACHATSATLTLAFLDELVDRIKPGKPDAIITSKRMRRKITALVRAAGGVIATSRDEFGRLVENWGGVDILVSDFIEDNMDDNDGSSVLAIASYDKTQSRAATKDNTPIFAVKFGPEAGYFLLHSGGIQWEEIGKLETKDAERSRIKFYVQSCVRFVRGVAVMTGATDGN